MRSALTLGPYSQEKARLCKAELGKAELDFVWQRWAKLTREPSGMSDADFDQTLHICRKSKVIKNCEIIAAHSQPFLRYGTTKFLGTPYHMMQSDNKFTFLPGLLLLNLILVHD